MGWTSRSPRSCAAFARGAASARKTLRFEANVTIATLSRIERGVTNPKWVSVRAIARALGVGMGELSAAVETEEARATVGEGGVPERR